MVRAKLLPHALVHAGVDGDACVESCERVSVGAAFDRVVRGRGPVDAPRHELASPGAPEEHLIACRQDEYRANEDPPADGDERLQRRLQ